MRKAIIIGLFSAILVMGLALPWLQAMDAPADTTLEWPGGEATKSGVAFSHAKHGNVDCLACHHKAENQEGAKKCSEAGCHDNFDAKDKKSANSLYLAMHNKDSELGCVGCHKVQGGPTKCTECHPKQ